VTGPPAAPGLRRSLGALDGTLLTIGAMVGTGIFLAAGDVVRAVPEPRLVLLVWLVSGLLTLAGALTYGELGAMYPRAGGLYHYLREAWGPPWGFLYGWTCLLVIMSGGIAAIAVGFAEYFGTFVPALASERTWWTLALPFGHWSVSGAQVSAALAIAVLTLGNHFGLREGAGIQNALTWLKLGAIAALLIAGLAFAASLASPSIPPAAIPPDAAPPLPGAPLPLAAAFLAAMIASLWTYDGWYALTASAGEMRRPSRDLPLALAAGVGIVIALYLALNLVYLRALPLGAFAHTTRVAEAAAAGLFGAAGARAVSAAVALSAFGCLAATILYSSRIYQPMAADGLFFRGVARIHPKWRTPVASLWLQSAWAIVLALTGSYTQLFTYVTFASVVLHVLAGLAVFRLRRTRPDAERPYRAWGYPVVPALFVLGMLLLVVNTLQAAPRESLLGLVAIAAGLPLYAWWSRRARAAGAAPQSP
jgi:APA family basic amino acid/polyamine antiporter